MTQPIDSQTGFVSGGTNLDAAARLIAAAMARPQPTSPDRHPMVIMMTDGDPLAGLSETDRQEQIAAIRDAAFPPHCVFITADTGPLDDATLLATIRGHLNLEG